MLIQKPWKRQGRKSDFCYIISFNFIFRLRDGLKCVLRMSRYGNQYLQLKQPWAKQKGSEADR